MMMALGPAIVTEAFPSSERGQALGIIGLSVSAGIIIGPTLGGLLLDYFSWHWIFLLNLPVGIIGTLAALRFVPATTPRGGQRFDYPGAVTLFISLIALLLALTLGQQQGFVAPTILLLLLAWVVFLALFILIEHRSSQPMIDLHMFQNSDFTIGLITGFITFIIIAGVLFLMPYYLINVRGYEQFTAGKILSVLPLTLGITAPLSGRLSDRFGTRSITTIGLLFLLLGYGILTQLDQQSSTWEIVLFFMPLGIGMGVFQSPNNSAIMGSVAPQQLGVASGFLAITRTLGQTTGIAIMNAFWASRVFAYANNAPTGDPSSAPAAAQVAGLHDTFIAMVFLITLALLLSLWRWLRRDKPAVQHAEPT
jgi:EmrB/QacA subfamily drug resistance transporter